MSTYESMVIGGDPETWKLKTGIVYPLSITVKPGCRSMGVRYIGEGFYGGVKRVAIPIPGTVKHRWGDRSVFWEQSGKVLFEYHAAPGTPLVHTPHIVQEDEDDILGDIVPTVLIDRSVTLKNKPRRMVLEEIARYQSRS